MKHTFIPYTSSDVLVPTDINHPELAKSAIEGIFPKTLSEKALKAVKDLEGTIFLFQYQGKLVITDESLDLTINGECGPRWVGDTLEDMETWLESVADNL